MIPAGAIPAAWADRGEVLARSMGGEAVALLEEMLQGAPSLDLQHFIMNVAWNRVPELRHACRNVLARGVESRMVLRLAVWCEARLGEYDAAFGTLGRLVGIARDDYDDSRRELMRLEWLRGGSTVESRRAIWERAMADADPVSQHVCGAQELFRSGQAVATGGLFSAIERGVAAADRLVAEGAVPGDAGGAVSASILARLRAAERVALVGNGPTVRMQAAGAAIEAHDCVVRFNFPVLSGFEAHVGRRTDIMLMDAAHRVRLAERVAREPEYGALPVLVTSRMTAEPAVVALCDMATPYVELCTTLSYGRGTTGFRAIVLVALALRRPVTLYGFDFFAPGIPGHYFGDAAASLQHEVGYESWFVRGFLSRVLPGLRIA